MGLIGTDMVSFWLQNRHGIGSWGQMIDTGKVGKGNTDETLFSLPMSSVFLFPHSHSHASLLTLPFPIADCYGLICVFQNLGGKY